MATTKAEVTQEAVVKRFSILGKLKSMQSIKIINYHFLVSQNKEESHAMVGSCIKALPMRVLCKVLVVLCCCLPGCAGLNFYT